MPAKRRLRPAIELVSAIGSIGFDLQHHSDKDITEAVRVLRGVNPEMFNWLAQLLRVTSDTSEDLDYWRAIAQRLGVDYFDLKNSAEVLLDKLESVHLDPAYERVWREAFRHLGPYDGPKYDKEMDALRAIVRKDRTTVKGDNYARSYDNSTGEPEE